MTSCKFLDFERFLWYDAVDLRGLGMKKSIRQLRQCLIKQLIESSGPHKIKEVKVPPSPQVTIVPYKKNKLIRKETQEFISVQCPCCGEIFGVNSNFVEKASEVLFLYSCPYCHINASF